jgi:hypothetical protein
MSKLTRTTGTTEFVDPTEALVAEPSPSSLPRRGLLLGAGVSVLAAAALGAERASAAVPAASTPPSKKASGAHPDSTPVTGSIASAAISGYTYRYASMFDFFAESSNVRTWGGSGVYSNDALHTTMEIPPGARIRDVEWYVANSSANATTGAARVWIAGSGTLFTSVVEVPVPAATGIVAHRGVAAATNYGPFPPGTMLDLIFFSSGLSQQVNGVRVGFDHGAATTGILPTPVRAYSSLSSSKIAGGHSRVIVLPASAVPAGTTGVLLSVTALNASAAGSLKVFPGAGTAPAVTALVRYPKTAPATTQIIVAVSSARQITLAPSQSTHVTVDVLGNFA